jgi:thiol-disulfide isomerase/thioredoxin
MSPSTRRRGLKALVAVAALGAGAWWAWRSIPPPPVVGGTALDRILVTPLETPQGGRLDLDNFRGHPVLVNFWATWCPPCVREMPEIDIFFRENSPRGWQVVGIAVDKPEAVVQFLVRTPVQYPIAMAGFAGVELARSLGNANGGLPYTVLIDRDGKIHWSKAGETTAAELNGQAARMR